jgi:hypothetical protein
VVGSSPTNNPGQGDHEVDVIAVRGGVRLAVQCKRFGTKGQINGAAVRSFAGGARTIFDATALTYVTSTNRVSAQAREFAEKVPIALVIRDALDAAAGERFCWCRGNFTHPRHMGRD